MTKAIYFDMDGTIADLYEVPDWLPMLRAGDATPYAIAQPKVNMVELSAILSQLKTNGYTIGVITWLSMGSDKEYDRKVREAKSEWLKRYITIEFDEIHMVKYATPKHTVAKIRKGILVDDNEGVCQQWTKYGGVAIDAKPVTWIEALKALVI